MFMTSSERFMYVQFTSCVYRKSYWLGKKNVQNMWWKETLKCISIFEIVICCGDRKTEFKLNKPVYFGQVVLDLSKTLMHKFYYD